MSKTLALIALVSTFALHAAQAAESKPLVLPKAPPPAPTTLPLNAQPASNGVYIPVTKSGNGGVTIEGLRNPAPGEKGAAVSWTIKTK